MPSRVCQRNSRPGFTLIELLVVIGIIVILLGILLPVVSTMRKKAQQTDTNAEMVRLGTAIHNYYQDYRSYPGPVPDSMIYGFNMATAQTVTGITGLTTLTSTENLVLGLLGGITAPTSVGGTLTYTAANITKGPQSLNYLNPQQNPTYVDVNPNSELTTSTTLSYTSWTTQQGATYAAPVLNVPEFLDHFSNPHPIIYVRARVGGTTVCDVASTSQYYSMEMSPYWKGSATTAPFPTKPDPNNNSNVLYSSANVFFQNPNITGTARSQDSYILISAGYDGIYGTSDDIVYPPQ